MQRTGSGLRASGADNRLERLSRERPEWAPWLAAYRETILVGDAPHGWPIHVRLDPARPPASAALDGASVFLDLRAAGAFVVRLVEFGLGEEVELDGVALLEAAIARSGPRWDAVAGGARVGPERLASLAELAIAPVLRAIAGRLEGEWPESWGHGYCPACGAWPTLVEQRGLERQRRLRCSRCASDWRRDVLHCVYCGERHHERLGSFAVEGEEERRRVETCETCRGYTKAIATLSATPAPYLALEDLATVELDLVALERGYRRPGHSGRSAAIRLAPLEQLQMEREDAWNRKP